MEKTRCIRHRIIVIGLLFVVILLCSFSTGRYPVSVKQMLSILGHAAGLPIAPNWSQTLETVIVNIRLPRILMACIAGACLSAAGACYQGIFQNPMASPDLLGASSGAAFGAAFGLLCGLNTMGVIACAFVSGLLAVLLAVSIAARVAGKKAVSLILTGAILSSLFSAGTSYIKLVADPTNQLPAITYWLMGSLSGTDMRTVCAGMIPMLAGAIPLLLIRWRLNLLSLGDEEASAMGIHAGRLRMLVILCATLMTAACVACCGLIGWIGLVVPFISRRLVGNDYRAMLPSAMLIGAGYLLLVDDLSRSLQSTEIPIGILTAFIGAPVFLFLLSRKESKA